MSKFSDDRLSNLRIYALKKEEKYPQRSSIANARL